MLRRMLRPERPMITNDHCTGATFCITLGFHAASLLCLLPLVWLVPHVARFRDKSRPLASADAEAERAE